MERSLIPLFALLAACADEPERAVAEPVRVAGDAVENTAKNVAGEIDDVALSAAVKSALVAEPDLKAGGIRVRSENGVVSLSGSVPDLGQKLKATSVASRVDGVARVENGLELGG